MRTDEPLLPAPTTYIGVKLIQAHPEEKDGRPGYAVYYPDGYVSWSPKDAFERAYFPLADPAGTKICEADVDAFLLEPDPTQIEFKTTLVIQDTITGSVQHEFSSCVDPANYDHELGTSICVERIKDRIWPMLGFVLQWGRNGLTMKEKS
jgi:hypothetical protein